MTGENNVLNFILEREKNFVFCMFVVVFYIMEINMID